MNNLILTLLLLGAAGSAADADAANLNNGQTLYENNCVICHGLHGHGDGIAAENLRKRPANIPRKLSSLFETDQKLTQDVMRGKKGMPAFKGRLSNNDVQDIFAYIRSVN